MSNQTALAKVSNLQMSTMDDLRTIGEVFAKSGYFKDAADMSKAIVKIIAGAELGFGPVASMTGIYIVKERVTLSANLIGAAIKRSGRYTFKVLRVDNEGTAIEFFEGNQSLGVSTFTMADAAKANLAGGDNWKKYPRNMCFARAMSNGAKWFCPDVFGGPIYTPDELGAQIDGETGEVIEHQPAPATVHAFPQQHVIEAETLPSPFSVVSTLRAAEIRALAYRKGKDADKALAKKGMAKLEELTVDEAEKMAAALIQLPDAAPATEPPANEQAPQNNGTEWVCGEELKRLIIDLESSCDELGIYKQVRDKLEVTHGTRNPSKLTVPEAISYKGYLIETERQARYKQDASNPLM